LKTKGTLGKETAYDEVETFSDFACQGSSIFRYGYAKKGENKRRTK